VSVKLTGDVRVFRGCGFAAAAVLAVVAIGVAGPAGAQLAPSSSAPIDITADNGTLTNATCEATWSGAAEALQGTSRLRANVIKAYLKKKPPGANGQLDCGATDRIEADGNVFYVTPDQVARGDHAVYTADNDQIVMTGNVIVVQGKNVVRGDRMTIKVATREVELDSAAKGRGTPGRVRGVFYPNQPGAPGSTPAAH
jgi:lipopolysaccharide export system protein LptA